MFFLLYIAAAVIDAVASFYFAWRYREVRKFLAGAFFVSSAFCSISISPMVPSRQVLKFRDALRIA